MYEYEQVWPEMGLSGDGWAALDRGIDPFNLGLADAEYVKRAAKQALTVLVCHDRYTLCCDHYDCPSETTWAQEGYEISSIDIDDVESFAETIASFLVKANGDGILDGVTPEGAGVAYMLGRIGVGASLKGNAAAVFDRADAEERWASLYWDEGLHLA